MQKPIFREVQNYKTGNFLLTRKISGYNIATLTVTVMMTIWKMIVTEIQRKYLNLSNSP